MGAMTEQYATINEHLDAAEKGLVESGLYDAQTARALFAGIRPPVLDNVVGNLADLQRQPLMPPGFEQGAMEGANPAPTSGGPAPDPSALAKTSREKLEEAGVNLPETPATSQEAIDRMSQSTTGPTVIDGTTAEVPQSNGAAGLDGMTKAELQAHADRQGISGVDQSSQTKEEMLSAIRAGS